MPDQQGGCVLNIPKMKTSFPTSGSAQVKPIIDWNDINEIHFTFGDFMKRSQVIKNMKNTLL